MIRIAARLCMLFALGSVALAQPATHNLYPQDLEGSVAIPPTLEIDCSSPNLVAAAYRVATDAAFTNVVEDTGENVNDVCQHVVLTPLSGQTTYYWAGRVKDSLGAWSAWSTPTSFTTRDPAGVHRIVFQNGAQGYSGTADADIRGSFVDPTVAIREWNQGGQDVIRTGRRPVGSDTDEIYRSLLQFDLTALSDPNAVLAAYVELTGWQHISNTPFNGSNSLYEVRRDWGEGTGLSDEPPDVGEVSWTYSAFPATWSIPGVAHASDSNPNADRMLTAVAREILTNEVGYKTRLSSRALVDSVKRWIGDPGVNHGLLLEADDESFQQVLNIASREHPDWTFRPRLVVYSTQTPARPPDLPPVAVDDAAFAEAEIPVHIAVLGNDGDQDVGPDPVRLLSVGTPVNGGSVVIEGEEVVYTLPLFTPADTFTYTITDGEATATATVRITNAAVCLRGNVNTGVGPTTDVLFVNESPGDQNRVVFTTVGQPLSIHLDAAPAGPSGGRYLLWIWSRPPVNAVRLTRDGIEIGCLVNPTPFTQTLRPQPIRCLHGASVPAIVCRGVRTLPSPASAPWTITRSAGVGRVGNFSLQGILQDPGAANASHFSVTNAVILRVQ